MMQPLPPSARLLMLALLLLAAPPAHAQTSLFADPKAREAGDVLTIVLAERTAAQRESGWQNRAGASVDGAGRVGADGDLSGRVGFDAAFNKSALSRNESVQSDLLRGTITVRVVDVDPAGNLRVEGERRISVNGEAHLMKISGLVRPFDVRYDNTVLSYQVADASIEYRRAGLGGRLFKPAAFARLSLAAVLGAALFIALR